MICIATFYSHFGAVRFKKRCEAVGAPARMMPVPRNLSSSCGTCVRFEIADNQDGPADQNSAADEIEQIVEVLNSGYRTIYHIDEE